MSGAGSRELCCVMQCDEPAEYVLGVLRASGEVSIGFCSQHTVEVMPSLIDGPYADPQPDHSDISDLESELVRQGVTSDTIRRFQRLLWNAAVGAPGVNPDEVETDGEFIVRILQSAVPKGLRVIAVAISGEADWSFQGIGGSREPKSADR